MKNILGINTNEDKKFDGDDLIIRRVDATLNEKREAYDEQIRQQEKAATMPYWLGIVRYFCFIIGIVFIINIFVNNKIVIFKEFIKDNIIFIIISLCLILIGILITLYEKKKTNKVLMSNEFKETTDNIEKLYDESIENLNVPKDALKIDIFIWPYIIKKNQKRDVNPAIKYMNFESLIFTENDMLCISDSCFVMGIPKASLIGIFEINKKINIFGWNKDKTIKDDEYKNYHMSQNSYGGIIIKSYYALRFSVDNDDYEVVFPPYELSKMQELTNMPVTKENNDK